MSSARKTKHAAAINDVDHGSVLGFGGSERGKTSARKKEKAKAKQDEVQDLEAVNERLSKHANSHEDTTVNTSGKENRKSPSTSSNGDNAQSTALAYGDQVQSSLRDSVESGADVGEGKVGDACDAVGNE